MKYIVVAYSPGYYRFHNPAGGYYEDNQDIIVCKSEEDMIEKVSQLESENSFRYKKCKVEIAVLKGDIVWHNKIKDEISDFQYLKKIRKRVEKIIQQKTKDI